MNSTEFTPYIKIALSVIYQAAQDASANIPDAPLSDGKDALTRWAHAKQMRDDAYHFLTTENEMLVFWCKIAGLHHRTLLRYAKKADWINVGKLHGLHQIHTHEEEEICDANL